jgi:hypothetical protein
VYTVMNDDLPSDFRIHASNGISALTIRWFSLALYEIKSNQIKLIRSALYKTNGACFDMFDGHDERSLLRDMVWTPRG